MGQSGAATASTSTRKAFTSCTTLASSTQNTFCCASLCFETRSWPRQCLYQTLCCLPFLSSHWDPLSRHLTQPLQRDNSCQVEGEQSRTHRALVRRAHVASRRRPVVSSTSSCSRTTRTTRGEYETSTTTLSDFRLNKRYLQVTRRHFSTTSGSE